MQVQPYLFFDGRCDEALAFYKKAIGAEVGMLMRWKDNPDPAACNAANKDKVMHASVKIGEATVMASDGRCEGKPEFKGFALTISAKTAAEADKTFTALSDGGQVQMPMTKTFFSERFGMLADKFGVGWMILVEQ
ncbi:MAG: VOC family protein [Rhizomicrobium sp.]